MSLHFLLEKNMKKKHQFRNGGLEVFIVSIMYNNKNNQDSLLSGHSYHLLSYS